MTHKTVKEPETPVAKIGDVASVADETACAPSVIQTKSQSQKDTKKLNA